MVFQILPLCAQYSWKYYFQVVKVHIYLCGYQSRDFQLVLYGCAPRWSLYRSSSSAQLAGCLYQCTGEAYFLGGGKNKLDVQGPKILNYSNLVTQLLLFVNRQKYKNLF